MDDFLWWTGALFWSALAVPAIYLVVEVIFGFAAAVSWCRWSYCVMRAYGDSVPWRKLPETFFCRWWELTGRRKGQDAFHGPGGSWRGIGDWTVHPRPASGEDDPANH